MVSLVSKEINTAANDNIWHRLSHITITYAVGVLSLRQSGTFHFSCMHFFRAEHGKGAYKMIGKYHAAAGKKRRFQSRNSSSV
jgi:hypothetical protein